MPRITGLKLPIYIKKNKLSTDGKKRTLGSANSSAACIVKLIKQSETKSNWRNIGRVIKSSNKFTIGFKEILS